MYLIWIVIAHVAICWCIFNYYYYGYCVCPLRILVQSGIYDDYISALSTAMSNLKQGDPFQEGVNQGCMINSTALEKVRHTTVIFARERKEGSIFSDILIVLYPVFPRETNFWDLDLCPL